jgi:serine/threonine-protein kinase
MIAVPGLIGLVAADARRELRELGLRWTLVEVPSEQPRGTVVGQSPRVGAELRKGGLVTLRVSTGPASVAVPDVVGLDEASARGKLEAAGFEVRVVDEPTTDPSQDGAVVSQDPAGSSTSRKGTVVTVTIARLG